jgi:2-beta-glucuronyltransferase
VAARRVVLISNHYFGSKRRAGFHFLAEAYRGLGWDVVFVTAPISWLSRLRRDPRFEYPVRREAGRMEPHGAGLSSYVLFTSFHPANLRVGVLNRLATPLYRRYGRGGLGALEPAVRDADLFLFESTPALLLAERFRDLNPRARFVYRVSDDVTLLGLHPLVVARERELAGRFDRVSVPSVTLHRRFDTLPNAHVDGHAVDKEAFDEPRPTPYDRAQNGLFLGFWPIDEHFLVTAAAAFPDVGFHVVGQRTETTAPNVAAHGELPFRDTIPFVQHASIGLNTVAYRPGVESLTDSLKVLQFSYCGLPIVAPAFLAGDRSNVVAYSPGDAASVRDAVARALAMGRRPELRGGVRSWAELAQLLAG